MAQRVQVVLEDDIDGGAADETVVFALDGATYEIDLSTKNANALRDLLAPYTGVGRRTGGRRKRSGAERSSDATEIRAWAADNGFAVSARGRVSGEIKDAYEKAMKAKKK
jgi:hypothetical protein